MRAAEALAGLAVASGDKVLALSGLRPEKDLLGIAGFNELAKMKEGGALSDAGSLLQIVRDDHDRVAVSELVHQIFKERGGHRVERRAGLIHQDHFGMRRYGARDAQPLLLAAR